MTSLVRVATPGLALLSLACVPSEPPLGTDTAGTTDATSGADVDGTDAADETSATPECGNGVVEGDEQCDDGMANADDAACTTTCTAATCGDGLVWADMEECDDANAVDDDECGNDCQIPGFCGDGEVEGDEQCDDGDANARDGACKPDCTAATCGDGVVHTGVETCDDGNRDNDDACTQLCAPPTCGDGFVQASNTELCDDGDAMEGDECNGDCTTAGLWTDTYNGPASNVDEIHGVAADSAGNVIVAGETYVTGSSADVWVRKYDPDGGVLWTQTFHGVTADIAYG
ncbi:MAG: DUF4215 domain-containing protein, partial [Myxococcales bacterium]|nr:DUF4215 domain-containing protein [Myxococcales bacterium]